MDAETSAINLLSGRQILAGVKNLAEPTSLLTALGSAHAHPRRLDLWLQRGCNQVSLCPLPLQLQRSSETKLGRPFN